jgi:hypothetical protein
MKKLMSLAIVVASMLWAGAASAGPVFDLTATTLTAVNNGGRATFALTSMLVGSLQITDAAAMRIMTGMTTEFGRADIQNFQFSVGNLMLNSTTATNVDFRAILNANGNTFSLFRLLFNTPMGVGGCDLLCVTQFGRFATARDRVNIEFRATAPMGTISLDLFGARFAFNRRQGQVPEPATFGLLAFGLLAGAAVARRRRAH